MCLLFNLEKRITFIHSFIHSSVSYQAALVAHISQKCLFFFFFLPATDFDNTFSLHFEDENVIVFSLNNFGNN